MPRRPLYSSLLVVGSVVLALGLLELGLRAANGYLGDWSNFVLNARAVLAKTEGQRFQPDPTLGYAPKGGTRSNGATGAVMGGSIVLAVGDSFTWGEEVEDDVTLPAFLQSALSWPVVNGGVSGYGFDQIVLRAEALAAAVHPEVIVVAFIADDIRRTEMRRLWGAEKPYFDLTDGGLVLRNVPVPKRPDPATTLSFWQKTLGYSYLFDFVLRRLDLLYEWFGDHLRVHPAGSGERIACALTERLAELQKKARARVLVVALYDPVTWQDPAFAAEQRRLTKGLLACAAKEKLAVFDTYDAMAAIAARGEVRGLYGTWHLSPAGNRLIAELIARQLQPGRR